jgi:lipoate-protein ligase A
MERMRLKDISFSSPEDNILYDEVLFALAEEGRIAETLRLWESPSPFIVLGRTGKAQDDIHEDVVQARGIPVLRRSSGGGTVVQGPGCFNYSLIVSKASNPKLDDLRASYRIILAGIIEILKSLRVHADFRPTSDLVLVDGEKKISGNAQRRGRTFILHHGTILYDFDLSFIARCLKMPQDIPEYRRSRAHGDFVANAPVSAASLRQAFCRHFAISEADVARTPDSAEREILDQLSRREGRRVAKNPGFCH